MVEILVKRANYCGCFRLIKALLAGVMAMCLLSQPGAGSDPRLPSDAAGGDKLLIGSMSDLVSAIGERKRRALLAAFEMKFDQAEASLGSLAEVVYCPQRQLRDSDNYDANVTGVLNDERVLLEVGARVSDGDIIVAYVVVPLRHYEFHNARPPRLQGYHEALYEHTAHRHGLADLFLGMPSCGCWRRLRWD